MMIRTYLIKALYANLLGPGSGHDECIEEPFLKYEIGVLNSSHSLYQDGRKADQVIDAEMNPDPAEVGEEAGLSGGRKAAGLSGGENTHESEVLRQEVDSELNFKSGACSLGLSFVLEGDSPRFRICLTWARYLKRGDAGIRPRLFQRHADFYVTEWLDPQTGSESRELKDAGGDNGGGGVNSRITSPGAILHVLSRRIGDSNRWVVKIFLENRTGHAVSKIQTENERIFQPQIRVRVRGAGLADLDADIIGRDHDYESDDLLYRNSRTKARGFLCAAVWGEVDPESADGKGIIGRMSWPDAESVPAEVRSEFLHPDARTEYLPLYAILQPNRFDSDTSELAQSRDKDARPAPFQAEHNFDASELAQYWDRKDIEDGLKPITVDYSKWIKKQRQRLNKQAGKGDINARLRQVGEENLQRCEEACKRIGSGIEFLRKNERARIAFCFMNTVMNDKYMNEREEEDKEEGLKWREFQMAFMLLCLRGIAGIPEAEREIADILWFPTGGGKTEAYLGLVIFCMAYRRLAPAGTATGGDGEEDRVGPDTDGGVAVISRYTLRLLTIQQFQRALGAVVAADVRRVENWAPDVIWKKIRRIKDPDLRARLQNGSLWGLQRFSIGLWIGTNTTPKEFPYRDTEGGRRILNCEGALLPHGSRGRQVTETGDPAQVQACPVCQNTLCLPKAPEEPGVPRRLTWIVKSPKSQEELERIPKEEFGQKDLIVLEGGPRFSHIGDFDGLHYYHMTVEIAPAAKNRSLGREDVDEWWEKAVRRRLDPNGSPLESTRPSMPGYFFLCAPGLKRPHDFAIFCTDPDCKLNKTEWFERQKGVRYTLIPRPFRIGAKRGDSTSVPISAFTYDEQVYYRCPSFVIATVDKFANLPFEPRCASLFGNVDAVHPVYGGYGRSGAYTGPVQASEGRWRDPVNDELCKVAGFCPPSLILQDELHLIEGQLGSMVGAYEMAVDVLSDHGGGIGPKYIASSATGKKAESQVGTVFRRKAATFPPPGIDSQDSHFSKIAVDTGCEDERPGRVYMGMATGKSTVILPIKAQSLIMSEIFKIRSNPGEYGLDCGEALRRTDPYWTFVSYFTDLRLLARFTNYYAENVTENVWRWSRTRVFSSGRRGPGRQMPPGFRAYPVTPDRDMAVSSVSVYCTNAVGRIGVAVYKDGSPAGSRVYRSDFEYCRTGENEFEIPADSRITAGAGETVWVGVINRDGGTGFESVLQDRIHLEGPGDGAPATFPDTVSGMRECGTGGVRLSINSQGRRLDEGGNIQLSSSTRPEELPGILERLKKRSDVDSLQASPVFGTGIDIDRLGVIEIMNQPKTSSGYIQASGRVGRSGPGLVISWLNARRVRDLNHYENFVGYHRMLHRFVEPVTAAPFSRGAIDLCLGPVLVAILRNARAVLQTRVDRRWVGVEGPLRMADHGDDPEVGAVRTALRKIATARPIAPVRRMTQKGFERVFDGARARWSRTARDLRRSDRPRPFVYGERAPHKPPEMNVVLDTSNHADAGLDYVYGDVPNSFRRIESTAAFYRPGAEPVLIRPFLFTTRYGPGALVTGGRSTWVVPSVGALVSGLSGTGSFGRADMQGRRGLPRYEVEDSRMKRILCGLNPDADMERLRLFSLPTNSSLTLDDFHPVFRCGEFPRWAVCHSKAHPSRRFLTRTLAGKDGKTTVRCAECLRRRRGEGGHTTEFYSVRYVLACNMGHLGDLDWAGEVHRSFGPGCRGDVFEWAVSDNNDDVEIRCAGYWGADGRFIKSSCGARTSYVELKTRSNKGQLRCGAQFVEGGRDPNGCPATPDGMSQARLISKMQTGMRLPAITTTLEVRGRGRELFESYAPLAQPAAAYSYKHPDAGRAEFVDGFLQGNKGRIPGITDRLIRQTKQLSDSEFRDLVQDIRRDQMSKTGRAAGLTERESLEEELSGMERMAGEGRDGPQEDRGGPGTGGRRPVRFTSSAGLHFEAMPFEDIRVTQVQYGYTREVPPPSRQAGDTRDDGRRIGRIVYDSARYTDGEGGVWYLANQLRGEGVFIHLDPDRHCNAMDVFRGSGGPSLKTWSGIYGDTDAPDTERIRTNPLFVWWHSFAHELVNQISVDSGFMGVALGERVYCVRRPGGEFAAGLFVYAAVPGADGTLGGLTSLVDKRILRPIIDRTLRRIQVCSNDPVCSDRRINRNRRNGAACHVCLMNSETSCAYRNKFLDRNLVAETL